MFHFVSRAGESRTLVRSQHEPYFIKSQPIIMPFDVYSLSSFKGCVLPCLMLPTVVVEEVGSKRWERDEPNLSCNLVRRLSQPQYPRLS